MATSDTDHPTRISVRCEDDPETVRQADAVANELGLNRSDLIRLLVRQKYRELIDDADDADPA